MGKIFNLKNKSGKISARCFQLARGPHIFTWLKINCELFASGIFTWQKTPLHFPLGKSENCRLASGFQPVKSQLSTCNLPLFVANSRHPFST